MDTKTELFLLKQQLAQHRIWLGEAQLYILQLEQELEQRNLQDPDEAEKAKYADKAEKANHTERVEQEV